MKKINIIKFPINAGIVILCLIWMLFFDHTALAVTSSILALFLLNRQKRMLHPTNMLFLFYTLYLIIPVTLYYIFELVNWQYILPWGMVSDWSAVSPNSMGLVLMTFSISFFSMLYLTNRNKRFVNNDHEDIIFISINMCLLLLVLNILGCLFFVTQTGGLAAWISDYSNVYISGKSGVGWLNFILINLSHFTFFVCGFTFFSGYPIRKHKKYLFLGLLLVALIAVSSVQGIKSRVPILSIMFFFPLLFKAQISLFRGVSILSVFIVFFMSAMYFRSNGFYNSIPIATEYLLSYFNTYILLDNTMQDYNHDYFRTIWFSSTKFTSMIGVTPLAPYLDISYWLTDIYFPETWARQATQQWPLEMELYFNYGGLYFSMIPLLIMSAYYAILFNSADNGNHYIYFIFIAEFVRLFTILRGSMFPWTLPLVLIFYMLTYIFMKMAVRRIPRSSL
jgi:hypothetical protein